MARKKKNKNMTLIKNIDELCNEINYSDFEYKDYFHLIGRLIPDQNLEKLLLEPIEVEDCKRKCMIYIFVVQGKIFKIGQTMNSIKDRLQSYNCGKIDYRIEGTNSTTNYFVLQSLLKINLPVDIYAFFPDLPEYELFGKKYKDNKPIQKKAENILIKDFIKKYNRKPIGCTQK